MRRIKNNKIELARFIACFIIFSYHAGGFFKSGWIFVEFFFMLSGYFTFAHLKKKGANHEMDSWFPIQYTLKKFQKLFPYTTIGFLLAAAVRIEKYHLSGRAILKELLYLPASIFYIAGTGMTTKGTVIEEGVRSFYLIEPTLWYICAMFCAMPIMLYLFLWFGKKAGPWLITFFPFFLYGLLIIWDGSVNGWHSDNLAFLALDMRALAGMLLGGLIWYLARGLEKISFSSAGKTMVSIIEVLLYGFIILLASVERFDYDAAAILAFIAVLSLTLSNTTWLSQIRMSFIEYLGALSFPVYCIHNCLIALIKEILPMEQSEWKNLIVFVVIAILAALIQFMVKSFEKKIPVVKKKLAQFFTV